MYTNSYIKSEFDPNSSTTTRSRKNTNITLKNCGGTTALAIASIDISCRQLGTHKIPGCTFPMGCYESHTIISLSTMTSMGSSLTPAISNRPLQPLLKPSISSLGNRPFQATGPLLFNKLRDMTISYSSCILGQIVNMRRMDIKTPLDFIADMI